MTSKIYYVGGSKGGVGKSFVSFALIDYLVYCQKENVVVIDTDTSNPDVIKSYENKSNILAKAINLDTSDGWIDIVNCISDSDFKKWHVVINSAARASSAIAEGYANILLDSLKAIDRELVTLWVMNSQLDSVELLGRYCSSVPPSFHHRIHCVLNKYFGMPETFKVFNESGLRNTILKQGRVVYAPVLPNRVTEFLYSERLTIEEAKGKMPIGNLCALARWRREIWEMFKQIDAYKLPEELMEKYREENKSSETEYINNWINTNDTTASKEIEQIEKDKNNTVN